MRPRRIRTLLATALGLIVLGTVWFYLAPTQLGGSATYVVTHGTSMEPRFHTGDLAIVRSQSSYHVGEIVAYHNSQLHTIVLHRIIAREGERYVFKGDNNNFVDPEHPLASQLMGALWLHIPGAGVRLQSIRSPAAMGGLIFVGILLLTGGAFTRRRRRRHRQQRVGASIADSSLHLPQHTGTPVVGVVAIGLIAVLPFIALALPAFTRPPSARLPYSVPYKQKGRLSYTAIAPPGPAYANDRAETGEPLFTHVLSDVDLRFGYVFETAAEHTLAGKALLSATVTSTSGWHTTLKLGPTTYFHGDHALATGTLDLSSLVALLRDVERTTAVSSTYTLAILPHVSANGRVEEVPLHTAFSPTIQFTLSELEAQPVLAASSSPPTSQSLANLFRPSASGTVAGSRDRTMYLSLVLGRLPVAKARTIALGGIGIVVGVLLMTLALVRPRRKDEVAAILARYGGMIVQVACVWQPPGTTVIEVADMEALARIADHYDRSILHECSADGHAFWVTDESGQFRYTLSADPGYIAGASAAAEVESVASEADRTAEWAPAQTVTGAAAYQTDPYEVVDQPSPSEALVGDVYADELELGGDWRTRREAAAASSRAPGAETAPRPFGGRYAPI